MEGDSIPQITWQIKREFVPTELSTPAEDGASEGGDGGGMRGD